MHTKLTLRMDERLIEGAKQYAAAHGRSLSQMVADYFAVLAATHEALPSQRPDDWEKQLSPLTRRLLGAAVPTDGSPPPSQNDYDAYLDAKHLGQGHSV